jgi:flagellar biosynthesis GTPase FlhF
MAMKKRVHSRKGNVIIVNFSGVESGGRRCPDGEYTAEITSADVQESSTGNPMIVAKWKISEGKYRGTTLYDNISLLPQALWKFKTLLETVGIEAQDEDIPAAEYASEMIGVTGGITVTNEKYEGDDRPKVTGYHAANSEDEEVEEEEAEEEEEEEEEEPRVRRKAKVRAKKEEEDEEEETEEEDEEEEDEEEEEEEEEETPKKRGRGRPPTRIKEGSRVVFDNGEGEMIKGTVTSLHGKNNSLADIEDKAGDSYQGVPLTQVELA